MEEFFKNNSEIDRTRLIWVFIVGVLDILFTLPTGAAFLSSDILFALRNSSIGISFYPGWSRTHHSWAPSFVPTSLWSSQFWLTFEFYFQPLLYFIFWSIIFLLFGFTPTARNKYRCWFQAVARILGIESLALRVHHSDMAFSPPPRRPTGTGIWWVNSLPTKLTFPLS